MTAVKKLTLLLCGDAIIPHGVSIRGGGDRFVMSVPISAYLLETREGPVVLDTGFDAIPCCARTTSPSTAGWRPLSGLSTRC